MIAAGTREQARPEAVHAAATFTPARTGLLQRTCACGGTPGPDGECAACKAKRLALQRRADSSNSPAEAPPIVHDVLRSSGQPLDMATRAFMEPRFGHDFSKVRVHIDARAAESAAAVNALAYAVGQHVVFGAGQHRPGTADGRRMVAHELAHVIQQGAFSMPPKDPSLGLPSSRYEMEAQQVSDLIAPATAGDQPTIDSSRIAQDAQPALRRWAISGDTATADREGDLLGSLALEVGAHFNDWKCIQPVSMRTFTTPGSDKYNDRYERFVQVGDKFDISNLTATDGPSVSIHLFAEGTNNARIAEQFYHGRSSADVDVDIETQANAGRTPIGDFVIFGHAGGNMMWGDTAEFTPSTYNPEDDPPTFGQARLGFLPRRCFFTRKATARSVGCTSTTWGKDFAATYLRKGSQIETTTASVRPSCTAPPALDPLTGRCNYYNGLDFAAGPGPGAARLDGPFLSPADFHKGRYWATVMGRL